ncbi:hypothetical protein SAMN06265379_10429 [Saccharicrinis carchari]|uniref:Uncharacterized protein n=1 Tax=Saccharicrinis carchari TaxID=1168039 RepID=A0A521CXQ1_SACCC|nr:hypothetical protein SAMN06265379_10429 [Saccharicrinis carchari]
MSASRGFLMLIDLSLATVYSDLRKESIKLLKEKMI